MGEAIKNVHVHTCTKAVDYLKDSNVKIIKILLKHDSIVIGKLWLQTNLLSVI